MELVEPDITLQHHLLQELKRPESLASPILDLLGARYVLSPARSLPGCSLAPLPPEWLMRERVAVHARPAPAPRFQTPPRVRIVEDEDAVKAVLGAANFDPREE